MNIANRRRALLAGICALGLLAPLAWTQSRRVYAIRNAKIYTLAGPPIENGTVVVRDGKIAAVGRNVAVPSGAQVIQASGLQVYPGLFDSVSLLGLTEIGQVAATVDTTELGDYKPQLLAAVAIHPASEHIPVARANGITHAVSAPRGGVLSGRASAIHLDGWTVEEMRLEPAVAMVLEWPSLATGSFDFATFTMRRRPFSEVQREYEQKVAELRDWLVRARHYRQALQQGSPAKFERDLKLEALVPVVEGRLPVLVLANNERDIRNAIQFCEEEKLKMILGSGAEAWRVKDLLKEKKIPVILRPTQSLPVQEDDPYDKPYTAPGELHAAGVKIAFATFNSSDSRTLPYEAAQAVPFGLPWEEALKAITIYPAQMFGLDDRLGTIEVGKIANLVVTDGDPLEITTQFRYVFIQGRPVSTDNRHRQLYEKYRARP
ncbi:MAG: amidohydrolase family protein [Acidobacteriia bacterium]|jgi:imidazolonepropionase-like amidohydrolase|nr:amidohydrolase family protein [Terriglobia bacterium]